MLPLKGLGACLIQDGKPIAFASKSLTGAESHYANIERELLAIIFACIRFNTYLQGHRFTVQSDHKPLEMIHLKSMHNAPPRLQRMLLQLQKYDMKIEYKPGSEMLLADALSRCPARYSQEIKLDLRVDYIAFTSTWIETLKETTCEDPVLSTVYQLVQHGWPKERRRVPNVAKYYWNFRDKLSTDEGLLLKGPSLIIPATLRENSLSLFVGFSSFFFFLEKVTWQILIFPPKIKQVENFHWISPFSGETIIFPNLGKSPNSWNKEVELIQSQTMGVGI